MAKGSLLRVVLCLGALLNITYSQAALSSSSSSSSSFLSTPDNLSSHRKALSFPYFFSLFSATSRNHQQNNALIEEKVVMGNAESDSTPSQAFPPADTVNKVTKFKFRGDDAVDDDDHTTDNNNNNTSESDGTEDVSQEEDDQAAHAVEVAIDANFMSDMADGFMEIMRKVKRRQEMAEGWESEWEDTWDAETWLGPSNDYLAAPYNQLSLPPKSQSLRSLLTLSTTYHNKYDTYTPSQNVKNGYNIAKLSKANEQTTIQNFFIYLLALPIIFFGLGILALFFLNFFLCCRCCFNFCKCFPPKFAYQGEEDRAKKMKFHRRATTIAFFFLLLIMLVADMLVYYGFGYLTDGITTAKLTVTKLKAILVGLQTGGQGMSDEADQLNVFLAQSTTSCSNCGKLSALSGVIASFADAASSMTGFLDNPIKQLDFVTAQIDQYAYKYMNYALYVVWGLALSVAIFFTILYACQSVCGMKFAMFWGMLIYFLIVLMGLPWMALTAVFGDVCMSPMLYIVSLIPKGNANDLITYYTSCVGNSTLDGYFEIAKDSFTLIGNITNTCETVFCPGDTNVGGMTNLFQNDMTGSINTIQDSLACKNLREIIFLIVNTALCTNFYDGVYSIWISQLVTSFFMFLVLLTASFSYQFMAYYQRVQTTDENPDAELYAFADVEQVGGNEGDVQMKKMDDNQGADEEFGDDDDI